MELLRQLEAQARERLSEPAYDHLESGRDFARRWPEQYSALMECSAFVNWRRVESEMRPILALSFR